MTQKEFVDLIIEVETGQFKPLGSLEEFKNNVLRVWLSKMSLS